MTIEEVERVVEQLRKHGYSDEQILYSFTNMYLDDKVNFEQYLALADVLNYTIKQEIIDASESARKIILRNFLSSK